MNIIISAKHFLLTDSIKQYTEEKMNHLMRFDNSIKQIKVELDADKKMRSTGKCRIEVWVKGNHQYQAGVQALTMYEAIDRSVPKLISQIEKKKSKMLSRKKSS